MDLKNNKFSEYNSIIKEYEMMYREAVKALGINDSAFWILYTLRDEGEGITQKDIVNINYLPPQTINSELKKLEKDGYIKLISGTDKRTKQVYLTEKGSALSERTAGKMMDIEKRAMNFLSEQELSEFLRILRKYIIHLQQLLDEMKNKEKFNE